MGYQLEKTGSGAFTIRDPKGKAVSYNLEGVIQGLGAKEVEKKLAAYNGSDVVGYLEKLVEEASEFNGEFEEEEKEDLSKLGKIIKEYVGSKIYKDENNRFSFVDDSGKIIINKNGTEISFTMGDIPFCLVVYEDQDNNKFGVTPESIIVPYSDILNTIESKYKKQVIKFLKEHKIELTENEIESQIYDKIKLRPSDRYLFASIEEILDDFLEERTKQNKNKTENSKVINVVFIDEGYFDEEFDDGGGMSKLDLYSIPESIFKEYDIGYEDSSNNEAIRTLQTEIIKKKHNFSSKKVKVEFDEEGNPVKINGHRDFNGEGIFALYPQL